MHSCWVHHRRRKYMLVSCRLCSLQCVQVQDAGNMSWCNNRLFDVSLMCLSFDGFTHCSSILIIISLSFPHRQHLGSRLTQQQWPFLSFTILPIESHLLLHSVIKCKKFEPGPRFWNILHYRKRVKNLYYRLLVELAVSSCWLSLYCLS